MIDENLLNKFNQIEDLPVSEEMLGAYLEGNLDSFESANIESKITSDSNLSSFVDSIAHDDVTSILDNIEHQLFDPSYPVFISDLQLPDFHGETISHSFDEEHMVAACRPEDFSDGANDLISDNLTLSTNLLEENLSNNDSFLGSDQSLNIESHESDDMFNEDSIDI